MGQPLTKWRCDNCGDWCTAEDGYVLWNNRNKADRSIKIVHQNRCDDRSYSASNALESFLGPDGLVWSTSELSAGFLHWRRGGAPFSQLPDMDTWVDFVRRTQVPYYEEARLRFDDEDVQERFADDNEVGPYLQRSLTSLTTP